MHFIQRKDSLCLQTSVFGYEHVALTVFPPDLENP